VLQSPEIEASFSWVFILLIILVVAMLLRFRDRLKLQS
jgi:hypothetical protein